MSILYGPTILSSLTFPALSSAIIWRYLFDPSWSIKILLSFSAIASLHCEGSDWESVIAYLYCLNSLPPLSENDSLTLIEVTQSDSTGVTTTSGAIVSSITVKVLDTRSDCVLFEFVTVKYNVYSPSS